LIWVCCVCWYECAVVLIWVCCCVNGVIDTHRTIVSSLDTAGEGQGIVSCCN